MRAKLAVASSAPTIPTSRRSSGVAWLAVLLTLEGCGVRAAARVLGISPTTGLGALRAEAARIPEPAAAGPRLGP